MVAVLVAVVACRASDPVAACAAAAKTYASDAVQLCRAAYGDAHAPVAGGSLARALAHLDPAPVAEIEAIANEVGDAPGGAEAWDALGVAYETDSTKAITAYARALAHRETTELRARARDAVGLYHHYTLTNQFRSALRYAGLAYDLASQSGESDLRGYVFAGVATLLYDIGDLPAVESLATEAEKVIDSSSLYWPHIQKLKGIVDRARRRPLMASQAFAKAIAGARTAGLEALVHDVSFEYAMTELTAGHVDVAESVSSADSFGANPDPEDWIRHVRMIAELEIARGRDTDAIATITRELDKAPADSIADLQAVRGHALAHHGDLGDAEVALLDAAQRYEAQRADLGFDALKPWLAAAGRLPLEDLFSIAAAQHRGADALAIAQRATARSMLDGLLAQPAVEGKALAQDLVRAGERVDGLKVLTHSLRSSAAAQPPPIDKLLASLYDVHVLTYFRARTKLWLIDLPAGGSPHVLEIGDVDDLRSRVLVAQASPNRLDIADDLGARLLPREVALPAGEVIHVVVDEPIRELAFAALRRDGAFVVERNPVVNEPSAAVLVALRARAANTGKAIVLGNATGGLVGAEQEAIEVASAASVEPKLRGAATRSEVLAARDAGLLHIATHTVSTPLGTALSLADGALGASDILDHGIGPSLVVLASCSSADPHDRNELGALASAFLAAGARTVIASRRTVKDDVALAFAREFYAADGVHKPALAAAIAQRRLIAAKVPIESWSTFVVFGTSTGGERR